MNWKSIFNERALLLEPNPDGGAGGGGGAGGTTPPADDVNAKLAAALKEIEDLKAGKPAPTQTDPDLLERTRKAQEEAAKNSSNTKAIEAAIEFNFKAGDFLKQHSALLPEEVKTLFANADKETFNSPVEKASEIKSGIIQSFFKVQENHDLLTAGQKAALANYLSLTKTGKSEEAGKVYSTILEPTLEMAARLKKAEEVNRARNGYSDNNDDAYKQKLMSHSIKHYGVK